MKTRYLAGLALVSALALSACGKSDTTTTNTTTTNTVAVVAAPAANEAAPVDAADAGKQNFEIINKTGHSVVNFNVSPANENDWGDDILGKEVLNDGESAKVTFERGATECLWDLKATYDDDDTTEMKGVDLCKIGTVTLNP